MMAARWLKVPSARHGTTKNEYKGNAPETIGCAEPTNTANDRKPLNEGALLLPDKA